MLYGRFLPGFDSFGTYLFLHPDASSLHLSGGLHNYRDSLDNALAENFFGTLKTECLYRRKPETFEEANKMIDDYIYFYNHERIQLKTGLSPLSRRQSG